jgi:hypothetical protein
MKDTNSKDSQSSQPTAPLDGGFSPWQRLKSLRISYLTLPLLAMATVTEFVILATGWKYQQTVCLPSGMGVTFFGIGPIGATILAVELLKLPLAIWTASRKGWAKGFMIIVGLPLICLLTFQLVKDMAVYEMGVAMAPASQMLEEATKQDVKIAQLNAELAAIGDKKGDRDRKLADLAARKAKAKADLEESLKRNDDSRQDAIALTDYQKKELSEVEERQANIIKQFDADTAQINMAIADLRGRREIELGRATKWNAEEARIENDYKAKLADYTNKKAAYEKDKADYDNANFIKRPLMKKPVDPGVPPEREVNTILKPTLIAELDAQIKAKEDELIAVNNKRRERVAQVDADAHKLRADYDNRSSNKREASDKKREELLAAQAAMEAQWIAEEKQINQDYEAAAQKVDGIRAEIDAASKKAEGFYEARETAIKNTQVHRIATTVEIVRGLFKGARPVSIKSTAKERGDLYTDQISMVRISVYPVLAFIVAFLPTLMVEIGFSTLFQPVKQRPAYRLGFLGRRLHELYIRAGKQKILRAERISSQASAEIAARDQALADTKAAAEKAIADKEAELQAAHEAISYAAARHEDHLKKKEEEWVVKLSDLADTLNRTVIEKDALRDLQKSEVERQIQMRQNAWSDRLTQMRQELDDQRAASEAERMAMMQAHHKKLLEVTEDCKTQVVQARRQAADAELNALETTAKLSQDLNAAIQARDFAESQLQQQADSFALKLEQTREDSMREMEKATRQEKHRAERQELEFNKTLRQREEDFAHQLKQREQELSLAFDARLAEEQTRIEQDSRKREADLERRFEARALEVEARWKQEVQQREEDGQVRLRQREQQLQAQAEVQLSEQQAQADQEVRRLQSEHERHLEAQSREANMRLKQELQQKEELYISKSRQRDQQWQAKLDTARAEWESKHEEALRRREIEADASLRELEDHLRKEMQQKDEAAQAKAKQREQDLVAQLTAQAEARQLAAQVQWETEAEKRSRAAIEPFKALLAKTEKERDEAKQSAFEGARHVQDLEKKLTEASSFLNGWRNGKILVEAA